MEHFKKGWKTHEFFSTMVFISLCHLAHYFNGGTLLSAIGLTVASSCYILSRSLFKKSRGDLYRQKTTEVLVYAFALIVLALMVFDGGISKGMGVMLFGIVQGSFSLSRGHSKGFIPRHPGIIRNL